MAPRAEDVVALAEDPVALAEDLQGIHEAMPETVNVEDVKEDVKDEVKELLLDEEVVTDAETESPDMETRDMETPEVEMNKGAQTSVVDQMACFDFSTLCCGLSSKGTCAHCQQSIGYNEDCVTLAYDDKKYAHVACFEKEEQEKQARIESEKATSIQARARGMMAREQTESLKADKLRILEEARLEAEAVAAAHEREIAALEKAQRKVEAQTTKKGFFSKLFGGCRNSKEQVAV